MAKQAAATVYGAVAFLMGTLRFRVTVNHQWRVSAESLADKYHLTDPQAAPNPWVNPRFPSRCIATVLLQNASLKLNLLTAYARACELGLIRPEAVPQYATWKGEVIAPSVRVPSFLDAVKGLGVPAGLLAEMPSRGGFLVAVAADVPERTSRSKSASVSKEALIAGQA